MKTEQQIRHAKEAAIRLASLPVEAKNKALANMVDELKKNKDHILQENKIDIKNAENRDMAEPLIKRLIITQDKFNEMIKGLHVVISLEDPIGKKLSVMELDEGLILDRVTCPIGVIGAIFESRPEVLVQIASLCLKSGNACILKGGSEASHSNEILYEIIAKATKDILPYGWIQLIETREQVNQILKLDEYIDLLIPRGSNRFIKYIQDNTKIPVLGHSEGICHIYLDENADFQQAETIIIDAKCQYPAACNAVETLLVHKSIAKKFLPGIIKKLQENNVVIKLDKPAIREYNIENVGIATEKDWKTEYLGPTLSIKIVDDVNQAISHINKYGSHHTDAILTRNNANAKLFIDLVDSSSVLWNCSTRFSDGYRYGKGAEVGISTGKIHSRGPVGIEGLVIYKYILKGNGHIVADYTGNHPKKFKHKKLL